MPTNPSDWDQVQDWDQNLPANDWDQNSVVVTPPPPPPGNPAPDDPFITDQITPEILAVILGPETIITRRVDIYEQDGTTVYLLDRGIIDGTVTVDNSRDERRMLDLELDNSDGALKHYPGGFWYDKVIKVFRGVQLPHGNRWEVQQGEFIIDDITSPDFPNTTTIKARDYTARLLLSSLTRATSFTKGQKIEDVIKAVALNGGALKFNLPTTGVTLAVDTFFDRSTTRWAIVKQIANDFGYDIFFDRYGYLTMQLMPDPATGSEVFTFKTGQPDGSLASYTKHTTSTQLKNHIIVYGTASTNATVFAEAVVADSSPVSPKEIGDRVQEVQSAIISTTAQAQALADSMIKVAALEDYDVSLTSIVLAFLDVNQIVGFIDPDPDPIDPSRFLLTSFSIPLKLAGMDAVAKRISLVQSFSGSTPPVTTPPTDPPPTDPPPTTSLYGDSMGLTMGTMLANDSDNDAFADLAYIKNNGAKWVVLNIDWDWIEGTQGSPNWSNYDRLISLCQALGLKVAACALGSPRWANGNLTQPGEDGLYLPTPSFYDEYGTYAANLAVRGADAVMMWNEPNNPPFVKNPGGPNAVTYANMVKVAYPIIKAAKPSALVVAGTTSPAGGQLAPAQFLTDCLNVSGFKDCFDHWAHHPYQTGNNGAYSPLDPLATAPWNSCMQMRTIWNVLQFVGKTTTGCQIWASEFGSCSGGTVGPYGSESEAQQAQRFRDYHTAMDQMEADGVKIFMRSTYSARDAGPLSSTNQEDHFGLYRQDRSAKPLAAAFKARAALVKP